MAQPETHIPTAGHAGPLTKEQRPGFVEFQRADGQPRLDDLWFMVGSRCNLTCTHCYVDSSPYNDTLEQMTVDDVRGFIEEATDFGLRHVYFTGGEPFINRDIIPMIRLALQHADCTVLTNATAPIVRHVPSLSALADQGDRRLTLRASLDHFEEAEHDAIRGDGSFRRTVRNVRLLSEAGLPVIVTASAIVYGTEPTTDDEFHERFQALFDGLSIEVKILPFTLEMGANLRRIQAPSKAVFISEDCMERPGVLMDMFQCHNGRTVQKIRGRMAVYPCPIIYDDARFELGGTLDDSFSRVTLAHKACYDFCYNCGGSCTD